MHHLITRAATLAAVALTTVSLAACGDSEDSGGATAAAADGGAFPATVEHRFGTTTIEEAPERVVTVGYTDQDVTLALGVVPVGVGDFLGGYEWRKRPWAQKALGGAQPKVVSGQQINFEAVAAQRPDLIIAINAGLKKADYTRLSRIAPTVGQSGKYVDFGMPWDEQTLLVGKALGRSEQAEKVVQDVKDKFAAVRAAHPEWQGRSSILAYGGPDGYGAYTDQDTRSRFLSDLGFEVPGEIAELAGDSFFAQFSQENFRLLDQDLVVMYGPQKSIEGNAVVRRLKAVKEGRIVYLDLTDQAAGALGFASALSLPYLLDTLVETLEQAADGDPATKVEQPA